MRNVLELANDIVAAKEESGGEIVVIPVDVEELSVLSAALDLARDIIQARLANRFQDSIMEAQIDDDPIPETNAATPDPAYTATEIMGPLLDLMRELFPQSKFFNAVAQPTMEAAVAELEADLAKAQWQLSVKTNVSRELAVLAEQLDDSGIEALDSLVGWLDPNAITFDRFEEANDRWRMVADAWMEIVDPPAPAQNAKPTGGSVG